MIAPNIVIGVGLVGLSALGLLNARRVLELSNVLRRLVERRGEEVALMRLRFCCVCAAVFGACIASGLITPMQWN